MRTEELLYGINYEHVVVAPHCDDEFIGCFELLVKAQRAIVLIQEECTVERLNESHTMMRNIFSTFNGGKSKSVYFQNLNHRLHVAGDKGVNTCVFWFPDPLYETHPDHKIYTPSLQERLTSNAFVCKGQQCLFGFYSVNMNAPYLHVLPQDISERKMREAKAYKSQEGYFKQHNDSFFFEGRILL